MERIRSTDTQRFGQCFRDFFGAALVEFSHGGKDVAIWNQLAREIRSQTRQKNEWIADRRNALYAELSTKYSGTDQRALGLVTAATERATIEYLCATKNLLPIGGSSDEELGKIGLRTDTRPTNPHFGDYRPAIFPEGWDMRPVTPEPDLNLSSFATIFNGAGEAVAEVMWQQT
jgi:hypothetical protein